MGASTGGMGASPMPTSLKTAVLSYLRAGNLAIGTRKEYLSTLRKWTEWGGGVPVEELTRPEIRDFLDWVHERAVQNEGTNPGRTANKARENLRAIMSWAWERDMVEVLPRFPKPRPQRDVAGRHYLTKAEINTLYFATHRMKRPRAWDQPISVGRYWRGALARVHKPVQAFADSLGCFRSARPPAVRGYSSYWKLDNPRQLSVSPNCRR